MPLVLTRRINEVFYVADDPIILESISSNFGSAVLHHNGEAYEIVGDRMTEVAPSVYVSLGRQAKGVGAVSLVIDAPQTITIGRLPGGQNVPDRKFRKYRVDDLAALRGGRMGFLPNRLEAMARLSAPISHPTWNRRYEDLVFRIEGDLIADVKSSVRPGVRMLDPRVYAPWASSCAICRGSLSLITFEVHAPCKGRGCLDCEAGQLRVESRCIAYRRDKPPTCVNLVKLED